MAQAAEDQWLRYWVFKVLIHFSNLIPEWARQLDDNSPLRFYHRYHLREVTHYYDYYGSKRLNTPVFRRSWKTQQVHCIGFGTGASAAAGGAVDGRARCKQREEDNDKDAAGWLKLG